MTAHIAPRRLSATVRTALNSTAGKSPVTLPAPAFDRDGYARTGATMRQGRVPALALPLRLTDAHRCPAPRALAHLPAPLRFAAALGLIAPDADIPHDFATPHDRAL